MPHARCASLFCIFYPPGSLFLGPAKIRRGYLRRRTDAANENLCDLTFGNKAGKVPAVDYASLNSSLQDEAASIVNEIARLEQSSAPAARRMRL
jgi:hypothetical protein